MAYGSGHPTEEVLAEMRSSDPPISYLVGTPKGRLSKLEEALLERPWQSVRPGVDVKVLPQENELYIFAQSRDRLSKERAMRRRQLKALWKRLNQLQKMKLKTRELLLKLGEARARYRTGWRLVDIQLPEPATRGNRQFQLCSKSSETAHCPPSGRPLSASDKPLWARPGSVVGVLHPVSRIEAALKNLKDDLALRPIFINSSTGSRPTFSWLSWPTACM